MSPDTFLTVIAARLSADPLTVILCAILIVLLVQVLLLSRRLAHLTRGTDGGSLEEVIKKLAKDVETLHMHAQTSETALNNLDERLATSVRAVSVRRFDPFQNSGGQQSFAAALLNESGDGVVISGIHARDSVRVYAKDVQNFVSERELSEDEALAIEDAKKRLR